MALMFPRRLKCERFRKPLLLCVLFNMAIEITIKMYSQPYYSNFYFLIKGFFPVLKGIFKEVWRALICSNFFKTA